MGSQKYFILLLTKTLRSWQTVHWQRRWVCWKIKICSFVYLSFKWVRLKTFWPPLVIWPVLECLCPAWHSSLTAAQSKALELMQQRAVWIMFTDNDYTLSLILAVLDTLKSRSDQLTERFFRCSVLCEASCLYYLLLDKRDSSGTDWLCHAKTFELLPARTDKFRNFSSLSFATLWLGFPLLFPLYCTNPAIGCYIK